MLFAKVKLASVRCHMIFEPSTFLQNFDYSEAWEPELFETFRGFHLRNKEVFSDISFKFFKIRVFLTSLNMFHFKKCGISYGLIL